MFWKVVDLFEQPAKDSIYFFVDFVIKTLHAWSSVAVCLEVFYFCFFLKFYPIVLMCLSWIWKTFYYVRFSDLVVYSQEKKGEIFLQCRHRR